MDRARRQAGSESLDPLAPERDVAHGRVVRQHGDDDFAIEHVGEISGGFEPERQECAHLLRTAHAGDHRVAGGGQILGHGGTHSAKSHKSNLTWRGAALGASIAAASP